MSPELEKQLFDKYPKIFRQKDLDMKQTAMCWGIECRDGWYDLIDMLCHMLQFHTDQNHHPQVEATQVKEKWGGLRFYTNSNDDYQEGLIDFAEAMSYKICEVCGSNKDVKTEGKGWIQTLCEDCKNKEVKNG